MIADGEIFLGKRLDQWWFYIERLRVHRINHQYHLPSSRVETIDVINEKSNLNNTVILK